MRLPLLLQEAAEREQAVALRKRSESLPAACRVKLLPELLLPAVLI